MGDARSTAHATVAAALLSVATATLSPTDASAFTHVVRKGETLASIATTVYGRPDFERVLVGANALDAQGGTAISAGMRLEIPALGHHRTAVGDTWAELADRFLGDPAHARILAEANHSHPWIFPDPGAEIVIPYVIRHFVSGSETIFDLAARYLGDKMLAWQLVIFNDLKKNDIRRGDVILVPLTSLPLTPAGEIEAAGQRARELGPVAATAGRAREHQARIDQALPELFARVSSGRFVEAVALGERLLGLDDATRSQLARIAKLLTVAYVALDAEGAAVDACRAYLDHVNVVHLEPATTSPKVIAVCNRARVRAPDAADRR